MSKIRVYIPSCDITERISINDKEIIHKIKNVLAAKKDEIVYVFDGAGKEYSYKIGQIAKNNLLLLREEMTRSETGIRCKLKLAIPLIKEQKFEFVLQKATELGVNGFIPFVSERSIQYTPSLAKRERWGKIILEAARQSQQLWVPEIEDVLDFNKVIERKFSLKLAASIDGGNAGKLINKDAETILIIVGPEGDFSSGEYEKLKINDFCFFNLSKSILRVETACIFSVGLINYFLY